jgi:hypothetical protein
MSCPQPFLSALLNEVWLNLPPPSTMRVDIEISDED